MYKVVKDGYILEIGSGNNGIRITDEEYNAIAAKLRSRPRKPGYGYRLKESMEWEEYELPAPDPDPELTAEEVVEILLGGA